MFTQLLTSSRP